MSITNRSKYIDVMKGLLIILVVIGHLPFFDYNSRTLTLIYSFHMPAFLIIGGMLSHINEDTKLSTILYKRIKGTLIPYFLFYFISFFTKKSRMNLINVKAKLSEHRRIHHFKLGRNLRHNFAYSRVGTPI